MPDLLRFPQPDGSTKVIDPTTGETTFENKPTAMPFGKPTVKTVELPGEPVSNGFKASPEITEEARQASLPQPDMTQQMAAHAEAKKAGPMPYPAGSPELQSLMKLDFRQRSQAMRLFQGAIDAWRKMPSAGTNLDDTDKMDRYFGALAAFDDVLLLVAVNPDAYRSWQKSVDDSVFADLFFAYVGRFGLGEA